MLSVATPGAGIRPIRRCSILLCSDFPVTSLPLFRLSPLSFILNRGCSGKKKDMPISYPGEGKAEVGRWRRIADVTVTTFAWRENSSIKPSTQECNVEVEWPSRISEADQEETIINLTVESGIRRMIEEVKEMFLSMGDGEITSSAYDTAWVAMVPDLTGGCGPRFPSCLQWIVDNQHGDGSWGYGGLFSAHDRIINTLACVVALRSWSASPEQCEKGILFLKENMRRLAEEDEELMPIGFEVALPSLLDIAERLGLDLPYDYPDLEDIYAKREIKLKEIPRDVMHHVPTTLLHSLEGMPDVEWDKLLRHQNLDGSLLFSPSSTAYALMQTGNQNCLLYLHKVVDKFRGGVPNVYPVDFFEHLWAVDKLQRLGISRYFEPEIKQCMEYVFKYWTEYGICWARNSLVQDIDDTAMGFRLLRLHGYSVSPDVFRNFEREGEFFGFVGQLNQAVTGMYNLNRASRLVFPGEEILQRAKDFSCRFLREKQASNQLLDKWVIAKDISGEIAYALEFPFYASLPRIETRLYIEQYGGADDVWIGKTLYRMPYVNNQVYLDLAKADFNQCQAVHQLEWLGMQRWYKESGLQVHKVTLKTALRAYFLAAAVIFEPDRSAERLGWAKSALLAEAIAMCFQSECYTKETKFTAVNGFRVNGQQPRWGWKRTGEELMDLVDGLIDALEAMPSRGQRPKLPAKTFRQNLRCAWEEWLTGLKEEAGDAQQCYKEGETALLLTRAVELCAGRTEPVHDTARQEYIHLAHLITSVCGRLHLRASKDNNNGSSREDVESQMQELVKSVCQRHSPNGLDDQTKQTFLAIAKSRYYTACCPSAVLDKHIAKVLFEPV
ncbi:hypothetical protein HPP92_007769 [Vanilla planifolia]|uniref:Terpene synthase N-terminal domain-containing protein n=1 Tax=Vanilla planifolia TaxID=51239 RepID=A0A835RL47_VANPL|nr:hypothetical protein HPP92_007769 [Vanilla planifolia]